jgi:uncharacterized phiE125 gp8 family phage protein
LAQPAYTLVAGPDVEPLSLAEAKLWLRLDTTAEDALVASLITENRRRAERVTGKALVTQTWRLNLDCFPRWEIAVGMPPLASVSSIAYVDEDGATQTVDAADYLVDANSVPARITPAYLEVWPDTRAQLNAVTITFVAGTSAAAVDAEFVGRLKSAVAYCYRHREQRDEEYLDRLFSSLWCGTY